MRKAWRCFGFRGSLSETGGAEGIPMNAEAPEVEAEKPAKGVIMGMEAMMVLGIAVIGVLRFWCC